MLCYGVQSPLADDGHAPCPRPLPPRICTPREEWLSQQRSRKERARMDTSKALDKEQKGLQVCGALSKGIGAGQPHVRPHVVMQGGRFCARAGACTAIGVLPVVAMGCKCVDRTSAIHRLFPMLSACFRVDHLRPPPWSWRRPRRRLREPPAQPRRQSARCRGGVPHTHGSPALRLRLAGAFMRAPAACASKRLRARALQ